MEILQCADCADSICIQKLRTYPFGKFTFIDKLKIVSFTRPTPNIELIQRKGKNIRHFNTKYYDSYTWLAGCRHSNLLFCFPCLLFSTTKTVWTDTGYGDLNNLTNLAKKHDQSDKHIQSCLSMLSFGKNRVELGISVQLKGDVERHNAKVDRNRDIFFRLIDITCFLAKQELPFRAHNETESSLNKGNFIETVELLAKYDGLLENHLHNYSNAFTGLSNRTQNELISSIATLMLRNIKIQISKTDFVAVMIDETPDVSGKEQLVLILRYFDNNEIVDRFIGFIDVSSDRSAQLLSKTVLDCLKEYDCISKLVAQTYDGANVMSGENGVQGLVRKHCPHALYVWCSAHVLNLVLSKSCERISETKRFFNVIKTISNFFSNSTKRLAFYNEHSDAKKIPRCAPTRWTYNSRTVSVIKNELNNLIHVFEQMIENPDSWDGETLTQANAFLITLKDFEFIFLLQIFSEIFERTDLLYNSLQKQTCDIASCLKQINSFEKFLSHFSEEFNTIFQNTKRLCGPPKRKRNVDDVKTHYRRILIAIIDNILMESRNRYSDIKKLTFFQLLSKENFVTYSADFPEIAFNDLKSRYGSFNFNFDRLHNELKCIYNNDEFRQLNPLEIIDHLSKNNMYQLFPEVIRLAKLIVTIPVSSASAERSFSCLKRIHTYLRNTQGQSRLTDLSQISIEKNLLTSLKRSGTFHKDVLEIYLQKDRRVDLVYK